MSAERHSYSIYEDENNLFLDILDEAPLFGNRRPTSLIGSVFYCILLAGFAVLAVGATWIFHPIRGLVFQLLCSCNVALLVITGIFQQYLVYQVQKIRLQGYCVFSQKLKHIIRLPFATIAYGTAAMLMVMVWDPDISILSISTLLRIIMLAEVVCAASFMTLYIGYVHKYNSFDSQPDVLKSLYSPLQPSNLLEGLRYQDGGRLSDQLMALLQYQQENIHFLSEEILGLQESLSKYERSNDGSAPQMTGQLWNLFTSFKGIRWTMPGRTSDALMSWNSEGNSSRNKDRWRIVPAAIWWTIWKERNSRCFEDTSSSLQRIKMNCIFMFCYWCKPEYIHEPISVIDILGSL